MRAFRWMILWSVAFVVVLAVICNTVNAGTRYEGVDSTDGRYWAVDRWEVITLRDCGSALRARQPVVALFCYRYRLSYVGPVVERQAGK